MLADPGLQERDRVGVRGVARPDVHSNLILDRPHAADAQHLGQDRGRADDRKEFVRVVLGHDLHVERELFADATFELDLVDVRGVHVRGLRSQLVDHLGEELRLEIVQGHLGPHRVDPFRGDHDDLVRRDLLDLRGQGFPPLWRELLRIADVHVTEFDIRFDRDARDHEGTDDGPSPGFVHADDQCSRLEQLAGRLLSPGDDLGLVDGPHDAVRHEDLAIGLLEIGESVPRPMTIPSCNISGTGATPPLASFMFETGQWATLTPWRARVRTSFIVIQTQWAAVRPGPRKPIFSSHSTGRKLVSFRWASTSPRVSERCMWSPTWWRSAISFAFVHVSSDAA